MLGYRRNLEKCDAVVAQVFYAHAAYIVITVLGMACLCLWRPEFFLEHEVGGAIATFLGLFWGSRFFVQLFHYDRAVKARYPLWNLVFLAGFLALGAGFFTIGLLP
jgi:hypothetical protein